MSPKRNKVFISYHHHDSEWAEQLYQFLNIILAGSNLTVWWDAKLMPGQRWDESIRNAIETTKIAILLISPSYLVSQYTVNCELQNLLDWAAQNTIEIVPIIVEASEIKADSPLAKYQLFNPRNQSLNDLNNWQKERFFIDLAEVIYKLSGHLYKLDKSKIIDAAHFVIQSEDSYPSNIFFAAEKKMKIKG